MEKKQTGNGALIAEIRKLKQQIQNERYFEFRDVRDYLGEYIDEGVIEPMLWFRGKYYSLSAKKKLCDAINATKHSDLDRLKVNTFRN